MSQQTPRVAEGYFSPHVREPRPCWHCQWFDGRDDAAGIAWCSHPGCSRVRSQPETGCAQWQREPGADDGYADQAE